MKWIDKTDAFEERSWKKRYLEICEVLDNKIEVNLFSCDDINNYEIYVSYGVMYGIVYVHKDKAIELREEIKDLIYNDYMKNGYSKDMPTNEFIRDFDKKYNIKIPHDLFFDENEFMDRMLDLFESFGI